MVSGHVHRLHIKGEELPRLPKIEVLSAHIEVAGMQGDYNHFRTTKKRSTEDRALLLLPLEVIETLQTEGWPVNPGDLGENITLQGIPCEELRIGNTYRIGSEALVEITEAATPCKNLSVLPYIGKQQTTNNKIHAHTKRQKRNVRKSNKRRRHIPRRPNRILRRLLKEQT